jgi:hypothetical protein
VIQNPIALISEFSNAIKDLGLACGEIQHEAQPAPHRPHRLPEGKCALYVFSLSRGYGERCPAGAGRVLKVGRAGPNSNARFQSHHYEQGRAPSTLAATLVTSTILWQYLGIIELRSEQVGDWIRANTDRDNFYFDSKDNNILAQCEKYTRGRLGPVFEGG